MKLQNHRFNLPPKPNARVVVAMSGGVDSSVAAALCHHLGYETIGITLQLYDIPQTQTSAKACCAGLDIRDAKNTADKIGIPHYVLNYESRFRKSVIDDFADSYLRGETPVPCIRCNQSVKFTDLLKTARDLSADALITGHYVRRRDQNGKAQLLCARDSSKDQSYFLFATEQQQLDYLRFPLGDLLKTETRELAHRFNLTVAEKHDSQDICFVGKEGYGALLQRLRPQAAIPGDIIHIESGEILGQHAGIAHYTVGQRKGLKIGGRSAESAPLYVVALRADENQVIVGDYHHLATAEITLRQINWLGDAAFNTVKNLKLQVKFRSAMQTVEAYADTMKDNSMRLRFTTPQYGVSCGQACVFYDKTRVLGGGWIHETRMAKNIAAQDKDNKIPHGEVRL